MVLVYISKDFHTNSCFVAVFISKVYDHEKFNFSKPLFKNFVNAKFYKSRIWAWKNCPDLVGTKIRPKMSKNIKKAGSTESTKKLRGKVSKFKNDSTNEAPDLKKNGEKKMC